MIETPTRGAREDRSIWEASPGRAAAVRFVAFVTPIAVGWLAVRLLGSTFRYPESTPLWIAQAIVVAIITAIATERVTRRFLPLAFLLDQSLVFPDKAPSRFGAALRSNSLGRLDRRIDEIRSMSGDRSEQQAAIDSLELVAALSRHDRFTRGHTDRVRAYADLIAVELGLSAEQRSRLSWGVLLHDIGKLTVPEAILNKTSELTPEEWTILRQHPAESAKFLGPLEAWLGEWGRAAAEHHERWDGNGYPAGLSGKEISLAGRITAVADAYDVITSARSYKAPLSPEAARNELVRCASSQFDPVVVRAMLQVSVGRQRNLGVWSWLTEVPTVARLVAGLTTSASTVAVTVAASLATIATPAVATSEAESTPASLAFAQPNAEQSQEPDNQGPTDRAPRTGAPDVGPTTRPTSSTTTSPTKAAPIRPPSAITVPTTTQASRTPSSPQADDEFTTTTVLDPRPTTTTAAPSTSTTPADAGTGPTSSTTPPMQTTTTLPASTTTPAAPTETRVLYLTNPGSGTSADSQPRLDLEATAPASANVGNYDRDRNDDPGITISKNSLDFTTDDATKIQVWQITVDETVSHEGFVELDLYVAPKGFDSSKKIGIAAALFRCDPSCLPVATTTWASDNPQPVWTKATLGFGRIDETLPAGATLQLRVAVPDSLAEDDMMFAYDSVEQPAQLRFL